MIPHLEALLRMNEEGNMPMGEIVSHVVKYVALQGSKADFDALPASLRQEVIQKIDWYKREGGWFVVSNTGMEDYGRYAESFLEKVAVT
jgi:hypothetical protein